MTIFRRTIKGFVFVFCIISYANAQTNTAVHFIESLSSDQKEKCLFNLENENRTIWHFLPGASHQREGLGLIEMTTKQKSLFHIFLKSCLSQDGYQKVEDIRHLETILAEIENRPEHRDPTLYYLKFYGNPQSDKYWTWSLEGHHVYLHFNYLGEQQSIVPRFLGSNPAIYVSKEHDTIEVLKDEQRLGFKLINSLSLEQKSRAIISDQAYGDILTMNNSRVDPFDKHGIEVSQLSEKSQQIIRDLIEEYLELLPKDLYKKRYDRIEEEEFHQLTFSWAGGITFGQKHYYRIQGKTFLIEYDNVQNDGNHIHCVWREFHGDFGRDILKEHYHKHENGKSHQH